MQQYFEQRYQTALNDEQLTSLISSSHNVLLTARAGSGKTRVIVCKTALQIAYGALPDQILLLAFNKKAADEMATRLQKGVQLSQTLPPHAPFIAWLINLQDLRRSW